jgi:hypothetical protein
MMSLKCTWLFQGDEAGIGGSSWGFSESWYFGGGAALAEAAMDAVSRVRAVILAKRCGIVAYRIGQENGLSYVVRKSFDGPSSNDVSNLPVDAALCQVAVANTTTYKRFYYHDLPDDWVNGGAIVNARIAAIRAVTSEIARQGFQVRYQVTTAPQANVLAIDAQGNVTVQQNIAAVPNATLRMLKVRDINNRAMKGTYVVDTQTDPTHFKLRGWPGNVVARSGKVRLVQYAFGNAIDFGRQGVIRGGARKVGRPFFQLRGRVSARR